MRIVFIRITKLKIGQNIVWTIPRLFLCDSFVRRITINLLDLFHNLKSVISFLIYWNFILMHIFQVFSQHKNHKLLRHAYIESILVFPDFTIGSSLTYVILIKNGVAEFSCLRPRNLVVLAVYQAFFLMRFSGIYQLRYDAYILARSSNVTCSIKHHNLISAMWNDDR